MGSTVVTVYLPLMFLTWVGLDRGWHCCNRLLAVLMFWRPGLALL
jgi:hypothetical protein